MNIPTTANQKKKKKKKKKNYNGCINSPDIFEKI